MKSQAKQLNFFLLSQERKHRNNPKVLKALQEARSDIYRFIDDTDNKPLQGYLRKAYQELCFWHSNYAKEYDLNDERDYEVVEGNYLDRKIYGKLLARVAE